MKGVKDFFGEIKEYIMLRPLFAELLFKCGWEMGYKKAMAEYFELDEATKDEAEEDCNLFLQSMTKGEYSKE